MRGRYRVANAPAGECGVKSQVSCECLLFIFTSDDQKKYWELSFREDMDGGSVRNDFQEMPLGAEKGNLKYPFPQGCDTAECAAFAERVE